MTLSSEILTAISEITSLLSRRGGFVALE